MSERYTRILREYIDRQEPKQVVVSDHFASIEDARALVADVESRPGWPDQYEDFEDYCNATEFINEWEDASCS